ncbi:MAG: glycosyltransferase [Clostridia bacterium]|nr:glycosyltransferase [Clostridia bacterium]
MKFSIIVPVYNVEKYLSKCLDSVINQTNQDFEVIVVNDGSPDNSQKIIYEYVEKYPDKIKGFIKENGGLSDARNYGIARASGEYIIFLDSDDYIDEHLLEKLDEKIKEDSNLDIIGYNLVDVNENLEILNITKKGKSNILTGEEAMSFLVSEVKVCFDPACGYAYRLNYWKDNKFEFKKGIYHEDFALIPLIILKAKKVCFTDFDGYFYLQTQNSITRNTSIEKEKKSMKDHLCGYDFLVSEVEKITFKDEYSKKLFMSYISNALIFRLESIHDELKQDYRKELKKRNVMKYVMTDTLKRKIRKVLVKIKFKI